MSAIKHNIPYAYRSTRVHFTTLARAGLAGFDNFAKCDFLNTKYDFLNTRAEC